MLGGQGRAKWLSANNKRVYLEGVADTEVEGCVVQVGVGNHPSLTIGLVGIMELNTPVEAQYKHREVEPQAEARVERNLWEE